jgi:hypothetical protein
MTILYLKVTMKSTRFSILCVTALCLCAGSMAFAEENLFAKPQGGQNVVGIKLGVINGTTFTVTQRMANSVDSTYQSRAGLMGGIFFDMRLSDSRRLSINVDIIDVGVNSDREKLLDIGLAFKQRVSAHDSPFILRPAVGAGLGYMADINFLKASSFLTVKGYCEMLLHTEKPHTYLLELGLIAAPSGGNRVHDVRFSPMVYLRGGIVY